MDRSPAFQFYPGNWLSSPKVAQMQPAEEGAYIRLLAYAWADPDCSLPDDDEILARLSRLNEGWFNGSSKILRACFHPHPDKPGRLANARLLLERQRQQEWREKSRLGGIQSGRSRNSAKGGSGVVEPNAKGGSILVEPKGNSSSSSSSSSSSLMKEEEGRDAGPAHAEPAGGAKQKGKLSDEAFVEALRGNPAYQHFDVDIELGKLDAWLLSPRGHGKKKTRQRIITWLNKAADDHREVKMSAGRSSAPCVWRVANGRHSKPCGKAVMGTEPHCEEHLPLYRAERERVAKLQEAVQ